jgi:rhodanese-related sulfurtransferase
VAGEFIKAGYSKVSALKGGWNEWAREKYPVEPK